MILKNDLTNYYLQIKEIINQISELENNFNLSAIEKSNQIKKIKEQLKKISKEVDEIKQKFKLYQNCNNFENFKLN